MPDLPAVPEFAGNAVVPAEEYREADADLPALWAKQARGICSSEARTSTRRWTGPTPSAKWFVGGEVNAAYNALDRQVENGCGDPVAIYFEGEP